MLALRELQQRQRYSKVTAMENIWKARVDNIKEAYEAELAKLAASVPKRPPDE
jgi:hypothetical protein